MHARATARPLHDSHTAGPAPQIKDLGCKAGIVLNPATPLSSIEYVLDITDLILVMSVNPGFGGQSFIESQVQKIKEIKAMCQAKVRQAISGVHWCAASVVARASSCSPRAAPPCRV